MSIASQQSRRVPYCPDMEQAVLGCCLNDSSGDCVGRCIEGGLSESMFYNPRHLLVWQAMAAIFAESHPIDELTVSDRLRHEGNFEAAGGDMMLVQLSSAVDTAIGLDRYVQRVRETYLLREMIRQAQEAVEFAYDETRDVWELLDDRQQALMALAESGDQAPLIDGKSLSDRILQKATTMIESGGRITGLRSGINDLDAITRGFQPKDMVIIAARPSMGKTALAVQMTEAMILPPCAWQCEPAPIGFFSLEMPADQLGLRMACSRARVNMKRLQDGNIPREKQVHLFEATQEIKNAPLWIDERSGITTMQIRAKARMLTRRYGIRAIFVDYCQIVKPRDKRIPREQQIAEISIDMKSIAKDLGITVFILAQLNRESEKDKRMPRTSDLRESGQLEQDADVVILLGQDKQQIEREESGEAQEGIREVTLSVAKHRNGPLGGMPLYFIKHLTRFEPQARI